MRIGIDMDGVAVETFQGFLDFYNEKFGAKFKLQDIDNHHIWPILGISRKKAVELMEEYFFSDSFKDLEVAEGMVEVIDELGENELFIVTSRPKKFEMQTLQFLDKYFKNINFEVLHTNDFHSENNSKSKAEICLEKEIDVFIEDCAEYSNEVAAKGVKVLLINKPWNEKVKVVEGVKRVGNWKDILEKIKNEC